MRERVDKNTPNAMHVYESVKRSIEVGALCGLGHVASVSSGVEWCGVVVGVEKACLSPPPPFQLVGPCSPHVVLCCWLTCPSDCLQDNIGGEELLAFVQEALDLPMYDQDCGRPPRQ